MPWSAARGKMRKRGSPVAAGCGNPGNVLFYHRGTETRRTADESANGRKTTSSFAPSSVYSLHANDPHASHEPAHLSRFRRALRRLEVRKAGGPHPDRRFARWGGRAARRLRRGRFYTSGSWYDFVSVTVLRASVVEAAVSCTTATPNVTRTRPASRPPEPSRATVNLLDW